MRLAWIVVAHDRPGQLARLISRLQAPSDETFLHINARVALGPFTEALGPDSQVTLLARHRVHWAGYGMMAATLEGMRAALRGDADYVSLISGSDYPIKPIESLRRRLGERAGANFMTFWELPNPNWPIPDGGLTRVSVRHYQIGSRELRLPNRFTPFIPKRQMPLGLRPYAGGSWWTLTREAVEYLIGYIDRHPEVDRFYRRSSAPDEGMPHTILLNSPLRETVVYGNLRHISFPERGAHPVTLDLSHFESLRHSDAFLARKFDAARDPRLLDLIDAELLGIGH